MMKKAKVWVSRWTSDPRRLRQITWERDISGDRERELMDRYQTGERLEPGDFPDPVGTDTHPDRKNTQPPDAFMIRDGYILVSGRLKVLLEQFDLGDIQFVPVTILKKNRKDAYDGSFFFINILEKKTAIVPDQGGKLDVSGRIRPGTTCFYETARGKYVDSGDVAVVVTPAAFEGVDLWTDSQLLYGAVFFSDRLRQACKAEKIGSLTFQQCWMAG